MANTPINATNSLVPLRTSGGNLETAYWEYRKKMHRLYSDAQVKELPRAFTFNLQKEEWNKRAWLTRKFLKYLKKHSQAHRTLEVGCGNGWLCHKLSNDFQRDVTGIDISLCDIEQARRVFTQSNLSFIHGDIFDDVLMPESFDIVVVSNSIHQFPNLRQLIERCLLYLKTNGEIHILDSPIFKWQQIEQARELTLAHYDAMHSPLMIPYHFHHSWDDFYPFRLKVLYNPTRIRSQLAKNLNKTVSPFPWVRIRKEI